MKSVITNAAEITVLRLIDNTFKTGGGPASVGATVVVANKGPVGVVTQVLDGNREAIFGKPMTRRTPHMEGLRHLADAAKECNYVNVVRVVPTDAKFPSMLVKRIIERGAWAGTTAYALNDVITVTGGKLICTTAHTSPASPAPTLAVPGANWAVFTTSFEEGKTGGTAGHPYGTTLSVGAGYALQVWPIDGDPSTKRSVEIADVVTAKGAWVTATAYVLNDVITVTGGRLICTTGHTSSGTAPSMAAPGANWKVYGGKYDARFTITFYDKDENNYEYLLESYLVGLDPNDKDDMGLPAYIETVLEQQSTIFRADYDEELTLAQVRDSLKSAVKATFTGGTNGTLTEQNLPKTAWIAAWNLFRNETFSANLMFAAGNYEADVLANCLNIAAERHVSFFCDVNPGLPALQALAWVKEKGLANRQGAIYYCPFSASDRWYGGQAVWGVSGAAAAACAKGDANFTGSTPGIHYAPAGMHRALLDRTGIKPLFPSDVINRDDFYDARINPVVAGDTGGAMIDDALSLHYAQNYSRFIWVNRIANYIDHRFVEGAAYMKFEPDGLTRQGLTRLTKQILDELVVSGALVPPRDPSEGSEPYKLKVEQVEIDLWLVTWDFCPTGSARRIAGQPRLIK